MSAGSIVTSTVKKALLGSRVLRLASRFTSSRIVILGYHSVQEMPEHYANSTGFGITHSTSVFESQMKLIAREYSPVSLDDVLLILQGKRQLRKKAVAVTFDDGYRDNCEFAEPILRRYGIPGAFYLSTRWIGTSEAPWFCRLRHAFGRTKRDEWSDPVQGRKWKLSDAISRAGALQVAVDMTSSMTSEACQNNVQAIERELDVAPLAIAKGLMMTWDQARKLRRSGHIVGSHTLTHPNLAHVHDDQIVREEIIESKRRIEQELQDPVLHFSYPHPALNPQWSQRTVEITKAAGYQTAVTTTAGSVNVGDSPFTLARVMVPGTGIDFRWELERAFLGLTGRRHQLSKRRLERESTRSFVKRTVL